jgi:hypothetical protein
VALIFRHEHAVDKMKSAIWIRADGVDMAARTLITRLPASPPIVVVIVSVVKSVSVDVVVVVVVVGMVSEEVVVVVVVSTSVDVVVVSVVVVVRLGVIVEVVVDVPTCNKLLQNEVAGALSPDRIDTIALTSLHTLLSFGPLGEARFIKCSPNGVASTDAGLRNRRTKATAVGSMSSVNKYQSLDKTSDLIQESLGFAMIRIYAGFIVGANAVFSSVKLSSAIFSSCSPLFSRVQFFPAFCCMSCRTTAISRVLLDRVISIEGLTGMSISCVYSAMAVTIACDLKRVRIAYFVPPSYGNLSSMLYFGFNICFSQNISVIKILICLP